MAAGLWAGSDAAEVPGAIKYQAVLRDVNGKALSGKENINLRISLRLDDPAAGQIAYSEEHTGITANAFGIVNLEIGRGTVTSGTSLQEVAWNGHSVYIQIEVETDGSGFTNMGTSELLTVPYAFMAGNVSAAGLYGNLDDNYIPKYNSPNNTLVNSVLSQSGRALNVDASSVTFLNSAEGETGYTFPVSAGKRGQALVLTDNKGTLGWGSAGEGGGDGGLWGDLTDSDDGKLIYWNNLLGELCAAPAVYRYSADKGFSLTGDVEIDGLLNAGTIKTNATGVEINGTVTGTHNLLTNDLGNAQIWIGNAQKPLVPRSLSGHVTMDATGKTALNMAWKGLKLVPGNAASGAPDTLALAEALSDSLWLRNGDDNLYAYNKGKELVQTRVGVGTETPQGMLEVHGGDVLFTAEANADGNTSRFIWYPELSALRAGSLNANLTAWDKNNVGKYSVAFGLDTRAASDYSFAVGNGATVMAEKSFALGENASVSTTSKESFAIGSGSKTTADYAVAIGRAAEVNGESSIVLGNDSRAIGNDALALGNTQTVSTNAVGVGRRNTADGDGAVVLGINNTASGENTIVVGNDNVVGEGSIAIGKGIGNMALPMNVRSVVVGDLRVSGNGGSLYAINGPVAMGSVDMCNGISNGLVAMGRDITAGSGGGGYVTIIGSSLQNGNADHGGFQNITLMGDNIWAQDDKLDNNDNPFAEPVFMFGSAQLPALVGFQIDNDGTSHFTGNLDVWGTVSSAYGICQGSDYRLKNDIRPGNWAVSLLDSLTPVSFRYKSDRKQRIQLGFIAQEVQKYIPELVTADAKGMLSMNYTGLIPVLWQINRQINRKVEELERQAVEHQRLLDEKDRKIMELESALKAEIQAIKAQIGM